jgi:hypothetical protein
MSNALRDAAADLVASMPAGPTADDIRRRGVRRRRRRTAAWVSAAVVLSIGAVASVGIDRSGGRDLVTGDSVEASAAPLPPTPSDIATTLPATTVGGASVPAPTSSTLANRPPRGVDDLASTRAATPVVISVLANDIDPDGDRLTLVSVTDPPRGTVTLDPEGQVLIFVSAPDDSGAIAFTYVVADESGATSTATVTIVVRVDP